MVENNDVGRDVHQKKKVKDSVSESVSLLMIQPFFFFRFVAELEIAFRRVQRIV